MGNSYVYNPDEVNAFFFGRPANVGRGPDEFLKIEELAESDMLEVVGVDGEVTVSKVKNGLARITLTLMQSSPFNDVLTQIRATQKRGKNGFGVGTFLCQDMTGRGLWKSNTLWVFKPPARTFGKQAGTREWQFGCGDLDPFDGGNNLLIGT